MNGTDPIKGHIRHRIRYLPLVLLPFYTVTGAPPARASDPPKCDHPVARTFIQNKAFDDYRVGAGSSFQPSIKEPYHCTAASPNDIEVYVIATIEQQPHLAVCTARIKMAGNTCTRVFEYRVNLMDNGGIRVTMRHLR